MNYKYSGERVLNLGAIDIGTNSCRLLVSRVQVMPPRRSHLRINQSLIQWKSIDSFCRIVKLGENLTKTGKLDEVSIQKTVETLHMCYKKICYYRVNHLRVVGTEACRKASNIQELAIKAQKMCNMSIDVISGEEEAELALLGCSELINWRHPYGLIFDIGGGSTEIIWVKFNLEVRNNYILHDFYEIIDSMSLPYGVVTVNDNLEGYATKEEIFEHVHQKVLKDMEAFVAKNNIKEIYKEHGAQMIGSSGTVTAFATLFLGLETYDRRRVDGLKVASSEIQKICDQAYYGDEQLKKVHIDKKNELMNVGAGILKGILKAVPCEELTVADRGVREGVIVDLIRKNIVPHFEEQPRYVEKVAG